MKSKTKIIIFSLIILALSISAASAHENIITDGNDAINNDMISINNFDDGLDDGLDDGSEDGWDDNLDDLDDDDWDGDSDDALGDLEDDSDDGLDDLDDDWDGDSDDWDYDDWDDDWDDDSDDWDYDDWDDDWDGNYTNSSIKFYKLISYYRDVPLLAYKTTSSLKNMTYDDSCSEDDCEDICDEDSQENSSMEDLPSFMPACLGASASSFEIPDVLSENQGSVSKSINQGQNLLDDEKETGVNVVDDKDYDTITFSSDNDLGVLGLLVSLLLCIILLI